MWTFRPHSPSEVAAAHRWNNHRWSVDVTSKKQGVSCCLTRPGREGSVGPSRKSHRLASLLMASAHTTMVLSRRGPAVVAFALQGLLRYPGGTPCFPASVHARRVELFFFKVLERLTVKRQSLTRPHKWRLLKRITPRVGFHPADLLPSGFDVNICTWPGAGSLFLFALVFKMESDRLSASVALPAVSACSCLLLIDILSVLLRGGDQCSSVESWCFSLFLRRYKERWLSLVCNMRNVLFSQTQLRLQ